MHTEPQEDRVPLGLTKPTGDGRWQSRCDVKREDGKELALWEIHVINKFIPKGSRIIMVRDTPMAKLMVETDTCGYVIDIETAELVGTYNLA